MSTSYTEKIAELEAILASMRNDTCDIDTLAEKTARATALLNECRNQLTTAEQALNETLKTLATPESPAGN